MRKLVLSLLTLLALAGGAHATPYGATHADDPPAHDNSQLVAPTHWIQQNVAASFNGRFGAISLLSADVTAALGFTPYNASNPAGYVNAAGASAAAPVQTVMGRTGAVALLSTDVTGALGFTPGPAYTLPTASVSTLGGVKVDGTSITVNGSGVISSVGSSSSAPSFSGRGLSVPLVGSFAWINQGVDTAVNQTSGPLTVTAPKSGNTVALRFLGVSVPGSTPWTATLQLTAGLPTNNGGAFYTGMAITDGTKFITHSLIGVSSAPEIGAQEWAGVTAFTGTLGAVPYVVIGPCMFLRIYNDGATYHFQVSPDGVVPFSDVATVGVTAFLTATKVGFVLSTSTAAVDTVLNVWGWEVVTGTGTTLTY